MLLCGCMFLGGCSKKDKNAIADGENIIPGGLGEYIVMKPNTAYIYEGDTDDVMTYSSFAEFARDGYVQRRIDQERESIVEVMRYDSGKLELVYTEVNYRRHEDLIGREPNVYVLSAQTPFKLNAQWTYMPKPLGNEVLCEVTAVDVEVTVPYGTFKTIEITKTYDGGTFVLKEYYAKGIGLVKATSISGDYEVSSELADIQEGVTYNESVPMFYMANGVRQMDVYAVNHVTNEDVLAVYNEAVPAHFNKYFGLSEESMKMTGVSLADSETKAAKLTVTIGGSFASELASSADAAGALRCVADTFGYLYGTPYVRLMSDGEVVRLASVEADENGYIAVEPIQAEADAGEEE